MLFNVFITTCSVFILFQKTSAENEDEVKRGQFPYMAFLYYPHLIPKYGPIQDAILLKPEWLLSAALDPIIIDNGDKLDDIFPRKTLMARVGALQIDDSVTFNEDEDEQEREVIQVVRPTNHNSEKRWLTDITLLKTLLPFTQNAVVKVAPLYAGKKPEAERVCTILFYTNPNITTEKKILSQHNVELLPAKKESCGNEFVSHNVMVCATDSKDVSKSHVLSLNFCLINSGGPLVCDDQVLGLQTYIKNTCTPPYLYQLLSGWEETFINCGTTEKCSEEYCAKYCVITNKDVTTTAAVTTVTEKQDDSVVTEDTPETDSVSSTDLPTISQAVVTPTLTQEPPKPSQDTDTSSAPTAAPSENVQKVARRGGIEKPDTPSASVLFLESEKDDRKIRVLNKTKVKLVSNAEGKYISALMGLPIIIVNLIAAI